ncbi:MAG: TIGR02996 domain-containing protein [Archangium sp.]
MQRADDAKELLPLFDAVFARPADDAPRQVLSDALLERGDARGEFISLQLREARGIATPAQRTRAANLLKHHVRRWLIEVPGLARNSLEFDRGFLRAAALEPTGLISASPFWRTIERLHLRQTQYAPEELKSPHLTRLDTLTGVDPRALTLLLAGPDKPALRELVFASDDVKPTKQEEVLALTRFRALEVLEITPRPWMHHAERMSWLFDSALARQLRRLALRIDPPWDIFGLHAQLDVHRLERLQIEPVTIGLRMSFDRQSLSVRFDDASAFDRHAQTLRNLAPRFAPHPFSRFDLRIADRRATRAELERLGELFLRHAS